MQSSAGSDFDTPYHRFFRLGWSAFWCGLTTEHCKHRKGSFEYRRWMDGWRDAADAINIKASKRGAVSGSDDDPWDTTS